MAIQLRHGQRHLSDCCLKVRSLSMALKMTPVMCGIMDLRLFEEKTHRREPA